MQKWIGAYIIVLALLLTAAFWQRSQASPPPDPTRMALPQDYRSGFVHYATVDRSDAVTRFLYVDPASLAALEAGEALPEGTRIVIEAYEAARDASGALLRDENGALIPAQMRPEIHMAEKRASWSLSELPTSARVGDWNFSSFDERGWPTSENLNDCFVCHDNSASPRRDFIFTRRDLDAYVASDTRQYVLCNLPERLQCAR